ncbi:MAG: hypothetical protein SO170_06540 [Butyribacter sp.]|nr:hypothetical protein [Butyribacter sp.]
MKKEELFETMEDIDKKYLEIADTYKPKKKRKIRMKGLAIAACLMLILNFIFGNLFTSTSFVTVYASELGSDKKMELSNNFTQIAEYSITQSSIPALCFNVEVNYDVSEISASTSDGSQLLKYKVDEDGTWNVTESGSSLKYMGNDTIYWCPTSSSDNITIILNVYSSEQIKDVIEVIVKPNDTNTGYVAKINM